MNIKKGIALFIAIAVSELAGIIGSLFTVGSIATWYGPQLVKPTWNPPAWVFGPVWTTLYALMGIAAFLVWVTPIKGMDGRMRRGFARKDARGALSIFGVQLVLNALWSIIFFRFQSPFWAFIELIFLWLAIVATMIAFSRIRKAAVWLLVPYILWVSFAGFLNYTIWSLNTGGASVQPSACTMEAKICPDGSAVGRTGPNCEFAACPASVAERPMKTFTDEQRGISFRYPETLSTTYMRAVDWPPQVDIVDEPFSCVAAGTEMARAGKTEQHVVNGHTYCLTKEVGAAAGSTYTNYAYALPHGNGMAIFTFSVQAVQCANYDEPKKTECEQERQAFDIDSVIDPIIQGAMIR